MPFTSDQDDDPFPPPPPSDLAFITGASTPMGLNIISELAKEGRDFFLHNHDAAALQRTRSSLLDANPDISVTALSEDIFAPTFAGKLFDALGGRRIQLFVHYAAVYPQQDEHCEGAHFLVVKKLVEMLQPRMEEGGVIILIASLSGTFTKNMFVDFSAKRRIKGSWSPPVWLLGKNQYASHAVSERCIQLYVRHKAPELTALGVRIVSMSLGPVELGGSEHQVADGAAKTSATILENAPIKRLGRPDEVSAVVSFLASARASYITGTDIPVDGGVASQPWKTTRRTASVAGNDKREKMQQKNMKRTRSVGSEVVRRVSTSKKLRPKPSGERLAKQDSEETAGHLEIPGEGPAEGIQNVDGMGSTIENQPAVLEDVTEMQSPVSSMSPRPRASITRRHSLQSLKSTWGSEETKTRDSIDFEAALRRLCSDTSENNAPPTTESKQIEAPAVPAVQNESDTAPKAIKVEKKAALGSSQGRKLSVGSIRTRFHRFQKNAPFGLEEPPPMVISLPLALQTKPLPVVAAISND